MFCVAIGIGQGFQPVSAFNYGAKKYKRVKDGFIFALKLGTCIMVVLSIVCFINGKSLVQIFRDDSEVIDIGFKTIRYQSVALVLMPITMYGNMLFQSIGESKLASFMATLRSGLILIPTIIIMTHFLGLNGLEMAQAISEIISAIISLPFIINFLKNITKKPVE